MGLFDVFTNWNKSSNDRAVTKQISRLIHPNVQHEDRLHAADLLAENGSDEAIYGLLRRFDMTLDKGYMDQDEKTYVKELVVAKGSQAIPMVKKFIQDSTNINWPERILSDILQDDSKVMDIVLEALEAERDAGDMHGPKRARLMSLLIKCPPNPQIAEAAASFFTDYDESVRFSAVEVLDAQDDRTYAEKLINIMVGTEEESGRVRMRILELLVRRGWDVSPYLGQIKPWLPSQYRVVNGVIVE